MAIGFRAAVESDFITAANIWPVAAPNSAQPGDYLLVILASPSVGAIWQSPGGGWEQLDGFSTVEDTLGAALPPVPIPISYALFGKFLTPNDVSPFAFSVLGAPTAVIGAVPGTAAGVALCAAYQGLNRAQPQRNRGISTTTPPIQITYGVGGATSPAPGLAAGNYPIVTIGPFTPVTAAPVPSVFATVNDWLIAPLITPGAGTAISLPGAGFNLRASTTGGSGVVIALADAAVVQSGLQMGLEWTATSMPTPLLTESLVFWPDASNLAREIALYATFDRDPAHFSYVYSQEPRVIANSAGYLLKVYGSPAEAPYPVFVAGQLNGVNLLVTRSDGSTFTQPMTISADGVYVFCTTAVNWFPYTGRYSLQLQLNWANGSVEYSNQCYLTVSPEQGQ